jgi:hypothetical protein
VYSAKLILWFNPHSAGSCFPLKEFHWGALHLAWRRICR